MKELWVKFKEWWGNLGERERKIIAWSASLLTIVIIYLWIWSPLIDSINNKRNRIKSDEKLLAWMEVADKEIQEMEKESQNKSQIRFACNNFYFSACFPSFLLI